MVLARKRNKVCKKLAYWKVIVLSKKKFVDDFAFWNLFVSNKWLF